MFLSIGTARNLIIFSCPNTYVYYGIPVTLCSFNAQRFAFQQFNFGIQVWSRNSWNTYNVLLSIRWTRCKAESCQMHKFKQEAHGPQLAHLSETATADMQMACNIFPILLWQGNGLNSFWNILLTRLKCWNFQNITSKISHPQCLLPTFESTGISVQ